MIDITKEMKKHQKELDKKDMENFALDMFSVLPQRMFPIPKMNHDGKENMLIRAKGQQKVILHEQMCGRDYYGTK